MIETYTDDDPVEGWQLDLGDPIVVIDYEDETHHIEISDYQDENTDITGQGYCHDHDQTCYFRVGAFEEVRRWAFTQ